MGIFNPSRERINEGLKYEKNEPGNDSIKFHVFDFHTHVFTTGVKS